MSKKKNEDGKFPVKENIHSKLHELVDVYTETHSKVLAVRFDLTYPEGHQARPGNEDISLTMAKSNQDFKRDKLSSASGWVREQNTSDNAHFHGLMLVDGQKTRSAKKVFNTIEKNWQNTIGSDKKGLIDYCLGSLDNPHENGRVYNSKDGIPDYLERQIDYMSKPEGKGEPKDGMRDFGISRLDKFKKKK